MLVFGAPPNPQKVGTVPKATLEYRDVKTTKTVEVLVPTPVVVLTLTVDEAKGISYPLFQLIKDMGEPFRYGYNPAEVEAVKAFKATLNEILERL